MQSIIVPPAAPAVSVSVELDVRLRGICAVLVPIAPVAVTTVLGASTRVAEIDVVPVLENPPVLAINPPENVLATLEFAPANVTFCNVNAVAFEAPKVKITPFAVVVLLAKLAFVTVPAAIVVALPIDVT